VQASIGMLEEGLSGSASTKDLDTLFELIYLRMTQPRADSEIFKVIQEQTRITLANQSASPNFVFSQALNAALTQDHPKAKPLTVERLDQMDLAKSLAFYKERFADASDFTFVFVGSFEPAVLQPLVERYLASLPALNRKEAWKDLGIRYPAGVVERRVVKGIEPRSQSLMVFTGPFQYDQQHRTVIRAMGMALEGRLRQALREELGGTYSVSASPGYAKTPIPQYSVQIAFNADPARLDSLMTRTMQEIERFKTTGPTEQELNDVREGLLREYEANTKTNAFWLGNIANRYQLNEELDSLFTLDAGYKALTPAAIQEAARTYLNPQRMVKGTLVPEK
jgi:zinc protease